MRGFRGYCRKILVVVRVLYGCCKTGKQVRGYNHEERAHITAAAPARRQSCVQCPKFFSGVSSRGFSLWAMWVLGRTFLGAGS